MNTHCTRQARHTLQRHGWLLASFCVIVTAAAHCAAQSVADQDTLLLVQFDRGCRADYALGSPEAREQGRLVPGRFGSAVDLSDGRTLTYVGNDGNFQPAAGTIEFWIKPHWAGNSTQRHSVFSCSFGSQGYININTLGKGRLGIALSAGSGATWKWRRADANISTWQAEQWHHVACSWGDGTVRIFMDGHPGETVDDARMPGAMPDTLRFNGAEAAFDSIRISRRAFSADDARRSIQRALGPMPYRFLSELNPVAGSELIVGHRTRLGDVRIPLVLGRVLHAKTLAVPAGKRAEFQLDGPYETLQADLGVDRFSARQVSCRLKVWGDDKLIYTSPDMGVEAAAVHCTVPLQGVKKVILECHGTNGEDRSTLGVWADAVLARAAARPVVMPPRKIKPERITMYQHQIDADRFTCALPGDAPFRIAVKHWADDLDPSKAPAAEAAAPNLFAFAAAGEYAPVNFVVYARSDVRHADVTATDLEQPGARIPARNADVRLVLRGLMRDIYSRPIEQATVVSRFLLPRQSVDIPAGTLREYQVTVHVPTNAAAGLYRGSVSVTSANYPRVTLPLSVEVSPIRLLPLKDRAYGVYYHFPRDSEDWGHVRQELTDIRAHGGTMLFPAIGVAYVRDGNRIAPSLKRMRRALDLMRQLGFHGPIPIETGLTTLVKLTGFDPVKGDPASASGRRFKELATAGLRKLVDARGDYPEFEFLATHMDEVLGRGRLPLYIALSKLVREATPLRLYITLHNSPRPEVVEMTRQIDPFVDVRSYNGHAMDEWIRSGHTFAQFANQLKQSGDEAWTYYNIRGSFFKAEWTRLVNGFYLWVSPLRVHVPWMYYSVGGNPLDDTDSAHHDFVYGIPDPADPSQMISTRHWEAFRAGVEDMRYLRTLESLVARHAGSREAQAASAWLDSLRERLAFTTGQLQAIKHESPILVLWSQRFDGADYRRFRRAAARHIQTLQNMAR